MARHPRPSPLLNGRTPKLIRSSTEPLSKTTAIRILPTQNPRGSQVIVSDDGKHLSSPQQQVTFGDSAALTFYLESSENIHD